MTDIKTKTWQKKALQIYDSLVCDISFDHISIEMGLGKRKEPVLYHIQELGYEPCPDCRKIAPIVNFNFHQPKILIKMCECGYESKVNRTDLFKAYRQNQ